MKSSLMRPALVLALALGLASCGGGKAEFTVAGTVTGQQFPGLVLTTNGMDVTVDAPTPPNTTMPFSFPHQIQYGDEYEITVKTQPAHQTCGPADLTTAYHPAFTGTAGQLAQINAPFLCVLTTHTIGGNVTGLTADGLVLANGSTGGTLAVAKGASTFTFGAPVTYGVTYGVTVLTQPTGLVCSVDANGAGVMGDDAITNIGVSCVPQT